MTLNDAIVEVRKLVNDTDSSRYRYSSTNLIGVGNQVLRRMLVIRPDLFSTFGTVSCTTGDVLQSAPTDSHRIIDIPRIQNGAALTESSRDMMNNYSTWVTDTPAAATEWMRHPRNPNKFYIYPPAPVSQTLIVEYVKIPTTYAGGDTITELPESYFPVLVDGIVWLIEAVDDEHVNSGRAQMFMQSFMQGLGVAFQAHSITDNEDTGASKMQGK